MIFRENYVNKIMAFTDTPFVKILTGVRRCGKSTIMRMIMEELRKRGISEEKIISFRFDSMEYEGLSVKELYDLLKEKLSKDRRDKIKTIILGDGITHVTKKAFQDYYYLEEVKIGKDVCVFDAECLFGDYSIHKITVDNENKHFIVKDGILYSSDLEKIVKFPPKQEKEYYEIPSHVKTIGKFAFANTNRLQCIKVGNNVSMIEEGAFACFLDLRHIYIDKDVDIADSSIFFTYDELRDYICFGGLIVGTKHGSKFEKLFADEAVNFCYIEDNEIKRLQNIEARSYYKAFIKHNHLSLK